ncbi:MAG: STAS domain-containing protein [Candidatus Baltobacteraceae bacterium]|jgi:anti-anti-sigma factor
MKESICDVALTTAGAFPIVAVRGELDHLSIARFEAAAEGAGRLDRGVVILSLRDATYFDSLAVHAVMAFRARLESNRQRLVLVVNERGTARRILEIVGIIGRVPTFATVDEALAAAPSLSLREAVPPSS